MKKAVVVIPTYNEAKNIEELLAKVFSVTQNLANWQVEVLIVDSHSPDKTEEVIKSLQQKYKNLHLLVTPKEGLGKAYYKGFQYAIDHFQPYVLFEMDADLSHDPKEIPNFLKKIEQGADFVIGSRYIKGGSIPSDWGFHRKIFSVAGNLIVRLGFMNLKVTDWTDGYRAIKVWVIKSALPHIKNYSGYVFQIALLDNSLKNKAHIREIPVNFTDRKEGISKINSAQYIYNIISYVLTHSAFVKFVIVGLTGFVIDFGISYVLINKANAIVWLATLISTETAIISNFFLNNFWSFSHKKINAGKLGYIMKFLKFNLVSVGSILIQVIGIQVAILLFGKQFWYVYKVFIIAFLVIPYSYFFYNKLIWKDK
jgi:dolichol-phosphate mannosyltransferase